MCSCTKKLQNHGSLISFSARESIEYILERNRILFDKIRQDYSEFVNSKIFEKIWKDFDPAINKELKKITLIVNNDLALSN